MVNIYDVNPEQLIKEVAEELKKMPEIKAPEWSKFAKTGCHKERIPDNTDWWHIRVAAVLRKTAILGPIGVNKLRRKYGGKRNIGNTPKHFKNGSGSVARKVLQQLESAKLVQKVDKPRKGRKITPKGMSLLDKTAIKILKSSKKEVKQEKAAE